ncbi:hypothetical protein QCA50_000615 [Cerrena zonata]|uniref:DUF6589 domain-containing protein n=1 Tax=Cerrena zonata TaxID=2478898 RepID=A0AAW0GXK6_9APHY
MQPESMHNEADNPQNGPSPTPVDASLPNVALHSSAPRHPRSIVDDGRPRTFPLSPRRRAAREGNKKQSENTTPGALPAPVTSWNYNTGASWPQLYSPGILPFSSTLPSHQSGVRISASPVCLASSSSTFLESPTASYSGDIRSLPSSQGFLTGTVSSMPLTLLTRSSTASTPDQTNSVERDIENTFSCSLFSGLSLERVDRAKPNLWYLNASPEDRLLVVLRALKRAGFATLGDFLCTLFEDSGYNTHPTVYMSISSFLNRTSKEGTRPIDLVQRIHNHPKAQLLKDRKPSPPTFPSRPRYALPRALRMGTMSASIPSSSTRNDILDFALSEIVKVVDREAKSLATPDSSLACKKDLQWSDLYNFSLVDSEDLFAREAPALFTITSTVAVNPDARKRLDEQACTATNTRSSAHDDSEEVSEADSLPFGGDDDVEADDRIKETRRNVWLITTIALSMLMFARYRVANMLATFVGVFLFTCNAHRDVFRFGSRVGLSISYSTTLERLQTLAKSADLSLQTWGQKLASGVPYFLALFDNVNKYQRVWRQTLGHRNQLHSGTAATLVKLVDIPPGAMDQEPLLKKLKSGARGSLTVDELDRDIDWPHLLSVGKATLLRVWVKFIPSLSKHRSVVEKYFSEEVKKHRLPLRTSEIQTLRCSNIDEATTTGVMRVIQDIFCKQLRIRPEWLYKCLIFVCGDQLSVDRLRKVKRYMAKCFTPFERHDWMIPRIELWHMKWTWQKCIFKMHWWSNLGKDIYGLHHDCVLLGREKFNHEKCEFYPAHHILEDRFDALALEGLRLLCEEETGTKKSGNLLDVLEAYFSPKGELAGCSIEQLDGFAEKVYNRYLRLSAYDDAQDFCHRDEEIYGPPNLEGLADSTPKATVADEQGLSKKAQRQRGGKPQISSKRIDACKGDQQMMNLVNFMRMTFWYREFCASIAEGDPGRTHEIIKVLRFSFWGAGATNYGNELLELACNFLKEYSSDLKTAHLNNWLVNPSGLPGKWHELDLLQEHFNFWLKRLFQKKTMDFDSNFLKECIGLNLSGFGQLRGTFTQIFELTKISGKHTPANTQNDINRLGRHYREADILSFCPGRKQPYEVPNEFGEGIAKLHDGQLQVFLDRTLHGLGEGIETNNSPNSKAEFDEVMPPPNPIIMENGMTSLSRFISLSNEE